MISAAQRLLGDKAVAVVLRTASSLAHLSAMGKSVQTLITQMRFLITIGDRGMSAVDTSEVAAAPRKRMTHWNYCKFQYINICTATPVYSSCTLLIETL